MKKSRFLAAAISPVLLLAGPSQAQAQIEPQLLAEESYSSEIWSGGLTLGMTVFHESNDGTLGGSYILEEATENVSGSLSDCTELQSFVLRCQWSDRYGAGTLEMTFSEDLSSFTGYWGVGNEDPTYSWNGSREINAAEPIEPTEPIE